MTHLLDLPLPHQDQLSLAVAEAPSKEDFDLQRAACLDRVRDLAYRFGADVLQDVEILEFHLARARCPSPRQAAERLLVRFGGLASVLAADHAALAKWVSDTAIGEFKLLRQTAIRLLAAPMMGRELMTHSSSVCDFLTARMRGLPREEFWVLFLDKRNHLLLAERLGQGTVDHVPVYPREVLRRALELNCSAMILAHNHPTGDPEPSRVDIELTKQIVTIARLMQISVHDHLIVGADTVASLRSLGLF